MKKLISLITAITLLFCSCSTSGNGSYETYETQSSSESQIITTDTTADETSSEPETTTSEIQTSQTIPPESSSEPEPEIVDTLSIIAVGDNLIHSTLITSGQKFGYDSLYEEIAPVISSADLAIINQETIFTYNESLYSGYPRFASPVGIGEGALNAGFDVFSTSTNHTADRGKQPMLDTLDFWKKHPEGICVGLHETKEDYNTVKIIERNNIKIALFNYTYGFNHTPPVWWMVEGLENKDRMTEQFSYAKENADLIIVMAHWGKEYVYTPNANQVQWAQFFSDLGADIIIGTHPHVVQPVVELTGKNGNKTICYYSLGNFISNQETVNRNVGGMAMISVVKDKDGVRIEGYEMIPTTVHREKINGTVKYTAILLEDYTDERLDKNPKFKNYSVQDFWDCYNTAITSYPK